jgi:hypothetical protein
MHVASSAYACRIVAAFNTCLLMYECVMFVVLYEDWSVHSCAYMKYIVDQFECMLSCFVESQWQLHVNGAVETRMT